MVLIQYAVLRIVCNVYKELNLAFQWDHKAFCILIYIYFLGARNRNHKVSKYEEPSSNLKKNCTKQHIVKQLGYGKKRKQHALQTLRKELPSWRWHFRLLICTYASSFINTTILVTSLTPLVLATFLSFSHIGPFSNTPSIGTLC